MSLLSYEHQFSNLRLNTRSSGEKSPHKVAMLLAVIDLIESGQILNNEIYFDGQLKERFSDYFEQLAGPGDHDKPYLPFFHLRSDLRSSGFWHHHIKPGKKDAYNQLAPGSAGAIDKCIAFAYLDDELFELLGNSAVRELLKAALYQNITPQRRSELLHVGKGWDWLESEAIVQDYFAMLHKELAGQIPNKTEHRLALLSKLNQRSEGSVEFKHQNISAVLIEMGQPYIQGYKPAFNYQQQLKHVVLAHMAAHEQDVESIAMAADDVVVTQDAGSRDWGAVYDPELPERIASIQKPARKFLARKTNYTERESNNRQLGEGGEAFVIEFERYRLKLANRDDLAKEVEWKSKEEGDGLGYDVRSFDPSSEEELFIEVKTTNSGKYQPFFISENEVAFSKEQENNYSLYRVYDYRSQARIFQLNGAVDQYVHLQAQNYKASFN